MLKLKCEREAYNPTANHKLSQIEMIKLYHDVPISQKTKQNKNISICWLVKKVLWLWTSGRSGNEQHLPLQSFLFIFFKYNKFCLHPLANNISGTHYRQNRSQATENRMNGLFHYKHVLKLLGTIMYICLCVSVCATYTSHIYICVKWYAYHAFIFLVADRLPPTTVCTANSSVKI